MKNIFNLTPETTTIMVNHPTVNNVEVKHFANAWEGFAKLKVRFKSIAGKAQIRIVADFKNKQEEILTWADETLLEIVVDALNGRLKVEEYLKTEHPALEIEALETEMFKQEILAKRKLIFFKDFVTENARYLHAVSKFYRGEINYYVKRTEEIEIFLEENGLVTQPVIV